MASYLLGFDVGTSSVKAAFVDAATGRCMAAAQAPQDELSIQTPRPGWAEQDPTAWYENVVACAHALRRQVGPNWDGVAAIGIAYQMHGLVLVDADHQVLRPSILWCDGRAVTIGVRAFEALGPTFCLQNLCGSPGNFTASKLRWVKENEPEVFARARYAMLPGDYVALRLTGAATTTASGLSEGVFWHLAEDRVATEVLDHFEIDEALLPPRVPTFGEQGRLSPQAAEALGLRAGVPVTYRAGDQPNNAFALGVLEPGDAAATAGTSGVIYGVTAHPASDARSRVNTFLHVTHTPDAPRYGVLLCLNGVGSLYRWLRTLLGTGAPDGYDDLNVLAAQAPAGSDGLLVLPFGNGAERVFENRDLGASLLYLDLNRHTQAHVARAAQEGIAFAFRYGAEVLNGLGLRPDRVRVGRANLFRSVGFAQIFSSALGVTVDLMETDGAQGAARAAGVGGLYPSAADATAGIHRHGTIEPVAVEADVYADVYERWKTALAAQLDAR